MAFLDISPFLPHALFSLRYLKLEMFATLGTYSACSFHKYTHAHQLKFHARKRENSINHLDPFFKQTTNSKKYPKDSFSKSGCVWFCGMVVDSFCHWGGGALGEPSEYIYKSLNTSAQILYCKTEILHYSQRCYW